MWFWIGVALVVVGLALNVGTVVVVGVLVLVGAGVAWLVRDRDWR